MPDELVLAGDIGGTKSNLAFYRGTPQRPEVVAECVYPNQDFDNLVQVVQRFRQDTGLTASRACLGIAGAVVDGESQLPNLGWHLSQNKLARELGIENVLLINDLEANAHGIPALSDDQLFTLNEGHARASGNRALISSGTGLGKAFLFRTGDGYAVSASEGGHVDFAPCNQEQIALLRFLFKRYSHVSVERIVSGPGLMNIYAFLKDSGMPEPGWLAERLNQYPHPETISSIGLDREADICVRALDLFVSIYGAEAGNLALTALATGGLYVGGGIAPKLLEKIREGGFMKAFVAKGRFEKLLADVPVHIILEPRTALLGAAAVGLGT